MSEITDRIASLAVDAGITVPELAEAAGISKVDFSERVVTGQPVSSLEIALVAEFAGRDPLWIITGEWPVEALRRSLSEYHNLEISERAGFNLAWNALEPFMPADVRDQVS